MKKIIYIIIAVVVFLLLLELLLRLFGFEPRRVRVDPFTEKMRDAFYPIDSVGVGARPGRFVVQIANRSITTSHNDSRNRRTFKPDSGNAPLVLLMGCSFTYGYGLNDSETYPYLVDSLCPSYHFINMAYPGDGTIQAKMRLQKYLHSPGPRRPVAVVVNYLSFHDERNTLNTNYRKKLFDGYLCLLDSKNGGVRPVSEMNYPFVAAGDTSCTTRYLARTSFARDAFSLNRYSTLANLLFGQKTSFAADKPAERAVSLALILKINEMCKQSKIAFYVSYMESKDEVAPLIEHCRKNKIPTIDLSIDFNDQQNFDLSFDPLHPGAKANRIFMRKFNEYLTQCSNHLK